MALTVLDPSVHLVRDTQAAKFFRRKLREPSIITFWHAHTGQWILGMWVHRGRKVVEEFEDLGPNMEAITDDFVNMIVSCYGSVDLERTKRRLLSRGRDRIRKQTDDLLEDQRRWDWLKKKTADKAPLPYTFDAPHTERGY